MTKLLSSVGVALVTLLAGCSLYFGNSNGGGDTGSNSPGGSGGGTSGGSPPGFQCGADAQCAAGCFCANGVCTEGGFCATDKDCGNGFHCDVGRSSCIPNPKCTMDTQCKPGSACDAKSGSCVVTCACANDAEAVMKGFGWCDESRNTCMTGTDPAGMCLGSLTCKTAAPACPENQVPLVKDGCFTGMCRLIASCEGAPACPALQHEDDCGARAADCHKLFTGHNCTGSGCGTPGGDCHCDSYTFAGCDTGASPPVVMGGG